MNFEFPFQDLPAVRRGPRVERRRVLLGGSAFWGTIVESGDDAGPLRLDDGRLVDAGSACDLPPVTPNKIIAVHISCSSRSHETRNRPKPTETPTYFTRPPTALNGHGGQILKPEDCRCLNHVGEYAVVTSPRASALGVGHAPTDTPEVRRVALDFDERVPERLKENLRRAKGSRR